VSVSPRRVDLTTMAQVTPPAVVERRPKRPSLEWDTEEDEPYPDLSSERTVTIEAPEDYYDVEGAHEIVERLDRFDSSRGLTTLRLRDAAFEPEAARVLLAALPRYPKLEDVQLVTRLAEEWDPESAVVKALPEIIPKLRGLRRLGVVVWEGMLREEVLPMIRALEGHPCIEHVDVDHSENEPFDRASVDEMIRVVATCPRLGHVSVRYGDADLRSSAEERMMAGRLERSRVRMREASEVKRMRDAT